MFLKFLDILTCGLAPKVESNLQLDLISSSISPVLSSTFITLVLYVLLLEMYFVQTERQVVIHAVRDVQHLTINSFIMSLNGDVIRHRY